MPATVRLATNLADLLILIRGHLASAGIFQPEDVYLTADTNEEGPVVRSDQFALITMLEDVVDQGVTAGADRAALLMDSRLAITIYNRLALDEAPAIDSWTLDASLGTLALVRATVDTMQMYDPVDLNGNYYFVRPLRMRSRDAIRKAKATGWGSTILTFTFGWNMPLS